MITGEIKSRVDKIWDAFWTGGISNPLEVMEQITYLLFIKRLDDLHTLEENKANRTKKPIENRIFPAGKDAKKRSYEDLRWSRFKNFDPKEMFEILAEHVFPFLRTLGGDGSTYTKHMKDARFTIPTPALLAKVVDMIDQVPMEDRDTKGDLYEYMLGKIASAGQNGQFRTPRHIIQLMVALTDPKPTDVICDPACGTAGFLVAAGEYIRDHHSEVLRDAKLKKHFHGDMFHGFDFDSTMLRIGSMNMLLHGVENPSIDYRDSLAQEHGSEEERYSLVLANPPFAAHSITRAAPKTCSTSSKPRRPNCCFSLCSCDCSNQAAARQSLCPMASSSVHRLRTRRCVKCWSKIKSWTASSQCPAVSSNLMPESRRRSCSLPRPTQAAPIMFGSTTCKPTANRSMTSEPSYATRETRPVAFGQAHQRRTRQEQPADILSRFSLREKSERKNARTVQSFCVPKRDIVEQGYDLSINRYKEVVHEEVEHRKPQEILDELESIEKEIMQGMKQLRGMLR